MRVSHVTVFDNLSEGHRAAVDQRAEFIEGDLANRSVVQESFQRLRPDAVMHFASNTLVPASMVHPGMYLGDNISNAVNLLDACVATGTKHFVFSSSCAIFGVPKTVPITEDMPKEPINPYGESKWMVERILAWYEKLFGIRYVCLRYFNAAGASEKFGEHHHEETHLIPNVLKVALGQKPCCRYLRHAVSHSRRHVRSRLRAHSRPGSGAPIGARRDTIRRVQSRQWQRLFGERNRRDGPQGLRTPHQGRGKTEPSR